MGTEIGNCRNCKRQFEFNPFLVVRLGTPRGPVCKDCLDEINQLRGKQGYPPIKIEEGTYVEQGRPTIH